MVVWVPGLWSCLSLWPLGVGSAVILGPQLLDFLWFCILGDGEDMVLSPASNGVWLFDLAKV